MTMLPPSDHDRRLQRATQLYQTGRIDEAAQQVAALLAEDRHDAPTLTLAGAVSMASGRLKEAADRFRSAAELDLASPLPVANLAAALLNLGRFDEAAAAYRDALARDSRYWPARHGLAAADLRAGRLAEAERGYREVLAAQRDHLAAWNDLGLVLQQQGRDAEAEQAWRSGLRRSGGSLPARMQICVSLGNHLARLGRFGEAIPCFRQALGLRPSVEAGIGLGRALHAMGDPVAAHAAFEAVLKLDSRSLAALDGAGAALLDLGRPDDAVAMCRRALEAAPERIESLNNLGIALHRANRLVEAEATFVRAIAARPDYATVYNNLGNLLFETGRFDEAAANQRRATELNPGSSPAHIALGRALQEIEDFVGSRAAFDRAVSLAPEYPYARWNRSLLLLLTADYADGWADYESRWHVPPLLTPLRHFQAPLWRGEPIASRRIMVWPEQGPGDVLMFASCLPDLIETGARISMIASPRLIDLLHRSFPQIEMIEDADQGIASPAAIDAEFQVPIGNLPLQFRRRAEDFPRRGRLVSTDDAKVERWRARLAALGEGPKIGISWRGGVTRVEKLRRTSQLVDWLPLLRAVDGVFVNLQYKPEPGELDAMRSTHGIRLDNGPDAGGDLDDYAAAIDALDLVICMANTSAHFAGALGRPVWVLTPTVPSWRWQIGREDSPWYPSMRLIRQAHGEPWPDVIARAAEQLRNAFSGSDPP